MDNIPVRSFMSSAAQESKSEFSASFTDFIKVRRLNSPGFFFVSFLIPIVAYETMGAGGPEMGLLFSLQLVGNMVAVPISGYLSNQKSIRGRLIFFGSLGRAVSYIMVYCAILLKMYWLMVVGAMCLGFGAGFFWTPMEAVIADAIPFKNRAEAYGFALRQDGIGSLVGSIFAFSLWGLAIKHHLPIWLSLLSFPLFAVANVLAGFRGKRLFLFVPQNTPQEFRFSAKTITGIRPLKMATKLQQCLMLLLGLCFAESLVGALVAPFLQVYLLKHITTDKFMLSILYMPGAIVAMIVSTELGKNADKVRPQIWLAMACWVSALATFILVSTSSLLAIMGAFIVQSLSTMSSQIAVTKVLSEIWPLQRGTIMGLRSFMVQLGGLIGPMLGGLAWLSLGDRSPFLSAVVVRVILAIIYGFFMVKPLALLKQHSNGLTAY